ncbi:MAG: protein phosphatase CheZ [Desulfobacterota bacterium]|jgi:chemotaxis protein CheZ|nr:protein phosphatase CheZ [Thermodesulfobacteriota bacterium]
MNPRVIGEIERLVEGKLSAPEIERLLRFMNRRSLMGSEGEEEPFFKLLAREMREEMKELATLIVEFKRDFLTRIHPEISELKTTYIPQAADQLEGIIESTEQAANQIMDNLDLMQRHAEEALGIVKGLNQQLFDRSASPALKAGAEAPPSLREPMETLNQTLERFFPLIADSFEKMSFQDLTGQRIRRTIDLVNLMEERINKTLLSFGLKLTEKDKNPEISGDDLLSTVEKKLSDLQGPQRPGEGMNQADIDNLLARL